MFEVKKSNENLVQSRPGSSASKKKRRNSARSSNSSQSSNRSVKFGPTTSGKGHASLNYTRRLHEHFKISDENDRIISRIQRVKSTIPSNTYYN